MRMTLAAALAIAPLPAKDNESVKRLDGGIAAPGESWRGRIKGIPQDMLENAHCVVIVLGLKTAAFLEGGKSERVMYHAAKGAALRQDLDDNATLYGKKLEKPADCDRTGADRPRRLRNSLPSWIGARRGNARAYQLAPANNLARKIKK